MPEDNAWAESRMLSTKKGFPLCILMSGPWGPEWRFLAKCLGPGQVGEGHSLIVGTSTTHTRVWDREVVGKFRTLLVSRLSPEDCSLMEITTGITGLRDIFLEHSTGDRGFECFALKAGAGVRRHSVVVWP